MKGPYGRVLFDVRRLWQCPVCKQFERTGGEVVTLHCRACRGRSEPPREVWMKLVEDPPATPDASPEPPSPGLPS